MAARLGVLQSIWNRVWWQERCGSREFRKCHGQRELITNEKVIERMDMSKESLRTITEVHLGLWHLNSQICFTAIPIYSVI